ncbi:SPASM domain-containing protein [Saccharothrix sp. S26]|uniref:radical SAM/SPASM domain-containing protein n=1 Tax=Saccharothrix sp. S26 TaxID=2907215 RepID=UPI001F43A9E0|nr:radical SAM protein [Saccharothrix sp. S26]MCE6998107.1 SPASM domain-containing protein [Saccharothrix sp. S26]
MTARDLFEASAPVHPDVHLLDTDAGPRVLLADGSRLFGVGRALYDRIDAARRDPDPEVLDAVLADLGLDAPRRIDDLAPDPPPVRALSLAVAQKCNLGCTYCYAQQGDFGGPAKNMPERTAFTAVDALFRDAAPGERVNLAFLGGEPLINRPVVRAATDHAVTVSRRTGIPVTFSITTNGTLLTPEDGEFFEAHGFAVTVSLDGVGARHDLLRPHRDGRGSYQRVMDRVAPLLAMQRRMQVSARVTVTPLNLDLPRTLEEFTAAGFHGVGFSPMLSSPTGHGEMALPDLEVMLEQMTACGEEFVRRVLAGRRYPFTNLVTALREIHRGTHRPYPCGAGAGYLGVSADGELSACHRFVGDADGAMGDLATDPDDAKRARWLTDRHVHRQEPCSGCWARYLCGGGCHHEVIRRGRPACAYIRGWLHHCLSVYSRLLAARPDYFAA